MRVSPQNIPPGQLVAAQVHANLAAGVSPRSVSALGATALPTGSVTTASTASTSSAGDAVTVDIPWKSDADAAIAAVEAKKGPLDDRMKAMIYADFAGRAAGEAPTAPKGAPIWKTWTAPSTEPDPAETEVTESYDVPATEDAAETEDVLSDADADVDGADMEAELADVDATVEEASTATATDVVATGVELDLDAALLAALADAAEEDGSSSEAAAVAADAPTTESVAA